MDLTPTEFSGPISSFQATAAADKASVFKMMKEINDRCERKLDESILTQIFEREWDEFDTKVKEVIELERQSAQPRPEQRKESDVLAEVLDRVRTIERETQDVRWQLHSWGWRVNSPPLSPDDRLNMEVAHTLIGRHVLAMVGEEQIEGTVVETLKRGTGTYVRIDVVGGTKRVVPLENVYGSLPPDGTRAS
jgi:hypothetical protein